MSPGSAHARSHGSTGRPAAPWTPAYSPAGTLHLLFPRPKTRVLPGPLLSQGTFSERPSKPLFKTDCQPLPSLPRPALIGTWIHTDFTSFITFPSDQNIGPMRTVSSGLFSAVCTVPGT